MAPFTLSLAIAGWVGLGLGDRQLSLQARCCSTLTDKLPGKVFMPDADVYDSRIESIFSATAALEPWCLVLPESTEDVSRLMTTISTKGCPFGIRSGGHAVYANANSVSNGITIDMGYMNTTTYNAETDIASVEPGARWGAVYDTLANYGVAVVGGRVTSVGVGGLILGGGNSFHSGKHGFACNTVQAYELVLGNGTVISVSKDTHPDLFRGLCGGSGNLGIVTRFDMAAVHLNGGKERPHIWGGGGNWAYENMDLIDRMVDIANDAEEDPGSSVFCGWTWVKAAGDQPFGSACLIHQVDGQDSPPLLRPLMDTPGLTSNTWRSAPISNFTDEVSGFVQHHKENLWGSTSFKDDPRVMRFAVNEHKKLADKLSVLLADDPDASALLIFQPLTSPIISRGAGKNVLGLENDVKNGPGMFTLMVVQAGSKENLDIARPLFRKAEKAIDNYARSLKASWRWTYLNYVDFSRDPITNYGPDNVEFLQKVAKAYDPQGVFQDLRISGHKVPRR